MIALTCCVYSDQEEQLWVWQYEADDGIHDMFMDTEEEVRFRVVQENFVDTLPTDSKPTMNVLILYIIIIHCP